MIITIAAIVYVASVIMVRNWIKEAYSKDGYLSSDSIGFADVFITVCPIANTIFLITARSPYSENKKKNTIYAKFFGL